MAATDPALWTTTDQVAAISVGVVKGQPLLDLNYEEDSSADVDMNLVMTGAGQFVEVQATGEKGSFGDEHLASLIAYGKSGVTALVELQKRTAGI